MSSASCPRCGAEIHGAEGFGMVLCQACGELVMFEGSPDQGAQPEADGLNSSEPMPELQPISEAEAASVNDPILLESNSPAEKLENFQDVVDFGNQDQPSSGFGSLVYNVAIEGIDTAEIREEVTSHLTDKRLALDVSDLMRGIQKGVMTINELNPVKASVIINRLKHLPLKIKWISKQLVKDEIPVVIGILILGFLFFPKLSMADDWQKHDINLRSYVQRINTGEEELKDLIIKKDHNSDPALRDKLLEEIKKKDADIKDLFERFREEKEHIIYEHPEQGDNTERKYKHVHVKTIDEIENETGIDGKLSKIKSKIDHTYPSAHAAKATASPTPASQNP